GLNCSPSERSTMSLLLSGAGSVQRPFLASTALPGPSATDRRITQLQKNPWGGITAPSTTKSWERRFNIVCEENIVRCISEHSEATPRGWRAGKAFLLYSPSR